PSSLPLPAMVRSDADGKFSFQAVQPGSCYVIDVQHEGYPGAAYPPQGSFILDRISTLNPAPGQRLTGVVITLARAILSGKVTNDEGQPMPGVLVRPIVASGLGGRPGLILPTGGVKTDSGGEFRFTDLGFNRYYLVFSPPGGTGAAKVAAPQEPELDYVIT